MIKTTVKIEGMACEKCEAHVNEAIRKVVADAKDVTSSHKKKESTFVSDSEPDKDALKKAIEEAGYTYKDATSEEYKKKGLFGKLKK